MNSVGRGRGAELLRRGLGFQPSHNGANGVVNRRNSFFSEQFFSSQPAVITGLGVVRPETDAPHGVERADFIQNVFGSTQGVIFHDWVL